LLSARGVAQDARSAAGLVRALDGVDLDVPAGETLAVMGPSGCGKSTLLHLLGGLDRPTGGEVLLDGKRIDTLSERALSRLRQRSIGFVGFPSDGRDDRGRERRDARLVRRGLSAGGAAPCR
jgi:putative ABC transport system ATP-binding protein